MLVGMWPAPLIIGVALAPESPWWLVRKGRIADAKKSLLRLTSMNRETDFNADETIDMMRHTTELESEITTGASYLDCFKGTDLRRTEIVCMIWAIQNLSGNSFSGYSSYFLVQAGLNSSTSYDFALGQYGINMVGVFGAWGLMAIGFGRRTLFVAGLCGLCVALFIMGFLGLVPDAHHKAAAMATGVYVDPATVRWSSANTSQSHACLGSLLPTLRRHHRLLPRCRAFHPTTSDQDRRPRPKPLQHRRDRLQRPHSLHVEPGRLELAELRRFLLGWLVRLSPHPRCILPRLILVIRCLGCVVYAYFRVPEPSGRTFAEIDLLFERKVSARKFASTNVNAFDVAIHHQVAEDKQGTSHVEKA